jgi:hypothetical protein
MVEIYKKVEGFENYSISDHGNVRNDKTGKVLKPTSNALGYLQVVLSENKTPQNKKLHQLVATAFLVNPDNKKCVDHIDNNRQNNNLLNLRFATHSQNQQNRSLSKNNTSGFKGVSWNKKIMKWTAVIEVNYKTIRLGAFINKEDAIKTRIQRAQLEFGAYINKCELVNIV